MAVGSMRVCECCFFFFFSKRIVPASIVLVEGKSRTGENIRIVHFSDRSLIQDLFFPSLLSPPEVQRDASLAARDYHTICISPRILTSLRIPANTSRPLDRDREREKNVKFFHFRSFLLELFEQASQILYCRRRYIYIYTRFYLTER